MKRTLNDIEKKAKELGLKRPSEREEEIRRMKRNTDAINARMQRLLELEERMRNEVRDDDYIYTEEEERYLAEVEGREIGGCSD